MASLSDAIRLEAQKLIRRHQRYASDLADHLARAHRRTGLPMTKIVHRPPYWDIDPGFDPYLVRARSERIGSSIARALKEKSYAPRSAVRYEVLKSDGTKRVLSVPQIADSALSRTTFMSLRTKNQSLFSANAFAYRTDLTLHDAIVRFSSSVAGKSRVFVAEFDFSKYFDMIAHEHIEGVLGSGCFDISERELHVLRAFLRLPSSNLDSYQATTAPPRERGIPQGTSASLFLANIAAHPLDRALEQLGVMFCRYADDTLIWSESYDNVCRAADLLFVHAEKIGVRVNYKKSPGISILTGGGVRSELAQAKTRVEYLGHSISAAGISVRSTTVARLKDHLSYLIYSNLLQPLKNRQIVPSRFAPPVDRDYVVMVFMIRRYLYGRLTESKLRRYLARGTPPFRTGGLVPFFVLVDDSAQLRALDGWLLHTVHASLSKRTKILQAAGHAALPPPHHLTPPGLLTLQAASTAGEPLDLRLPSFSRMVRLVRLAARKYGRKEVVRVTLARRLSPTKRARDLLFL